MALGYSIVRVNITNIGIDGIDEDDLPDDTPLTGMIELAPMVAPKSLIQVDDGTGVKLKSVSPMQVAIGPTGDILYQGRDYVKVLAATSSTTNLTALQWRATFLSLRAGTRIIESPNPIYFDAVSGAEINLAEHVNVAPSSIAVQLSRGPRGFGIGEVASEAGDFVFTLDDNSGTEVGRVAIPEAEVSDAAVAELVAPGTATKAVLDGTYAPLGSTGGVGLTKDSGTGMYAIASNSSLIKDAGTGMYPIGV